MIARVLLALALFSCGHERTVAPDAALPSCAALGCPGPFLDCTAGPERRCYCGGSACEP